MGFLRWVTVCALGIGAGCAGASRPPSTAPDAPRALVWPMAPAQPRIAWDTSFSLPGEIGIRQGFWRAAKRTVLGEPDDRLVRPQGVTVVGRRVYLADPGRARVSIYDREEKRVTVLDTSKARPWQMPISVAARRDGVFYVADAVGAVYELDAAGETATVLAWPEIQRPAAVAVDEGRGRLYVLDSQRHQLLWGDLDGAFRGIVGRRGDDRGAFNFPTHLTVAPDGSFFVTDAMNFRIQQFSPDGRVRQVFGQAGDGTGDFAKPKGIAVDSAGTIYVVDAWHDVVQMFDAEGRFLMHFGGSGRRSGQFWLPNGIAIDDEDRIYIADAFNHRVQIFNRVREEAS